MPALSLKILPVRESRALKPWVLQFSDSECIRTGSDHSMVSVSLSSMQGRTQSGPTQIIPAHTADGDSPVIGPPVG